MMGDVFIVVNCFDDPTLNFRRAVACNFEFVFHEERQLWEAWFGMVDTHSMVLLSPAEIVYEDYWEEYVEGEYVPGRDPV